MQNINHPTLHGPFHPPNHETTLGNVGAVRNTITFFHCQRKNSYLCDRFPIPFYICKPASPRQSLSSPAGPYLIYLLSKARSLAALKRVAAALNLKAAPYRDKPRPQFRYLPRAKAPSSPYFQLKTNPTPSLQFRTSI